MVAAKRHSGLKKAKIGWWLLVEDVFTTKT